MADHPGYPSEPKPPPAMPIQQPKKPPAPKPVQVPKFGTPTARKERPDERD